MLRSQQVAPPEIDRGLSFISATQYRQITEILPAHRCKLLDDPSLLQPEMAIGSKNQCE